MDWSRLCADDPQEFVAEQILQLLWTTDSPWKTVSSVKPDVALIVMDVLQTELDAGPSNERHRTTCMKCLRILGKHHDIVPTSFFCRNVRRHGAFPVSGGGFADIWKGSVDDKTVCLKVLRLFITGSAREELLRDCCREALVWRQLRHPNVLPFLGVSNDLFAPSFCLISPWMENGSIISFLQRNPKHDRLQAICEIAHGIQYLHLLDPQIVHGDIRGANILVNNDRHCCLADFGLSLVAESQTPASSAMVLRGSIRWLPPEMMDYSLFNHSYVTAKDIYSFGCTIIEIYTGKAPFSHIKTDVALINEVLTLKNKPPRPPLDELPSDELWALVVLCLSSAAQDRPNASTILRQLRKLRGLCVCCICQRALPPPPADVAVSSAPILTSSADPAVIGINQSHVGGSTSRRPSLTLKTTNLIPSNNHSSDSSAASSTSRERVLDSAHRVRPKGPRSPSTSASPHSAQSEREYGPTHTKVAVTPPTPLDNTAPILSPITPLHIGKRVDTECLSPPKAPSKNKYPINELFKVWQSKPGDVVKKTSSRDLGLLEPVSAPFKWVRGVPIALGAYCQVSFALNATVREVMVVKQVEIPANRDQSLHHRASRMIKHMYEILKGLEHPNVVRCLGLELNTSGVSLFFEYVPGATIHDLVKKYGRFGDIELTKFFLGHVVDGVVFLHSQGVIHRDLKAENVLVEENGRCKITCFGVSKRIDDLGARTKTPVHGSVFWTAPEAMSLELRQSRADVKVDVWSIGCIACEMWAGIDSDDDLPHVEPEDWYQVLPTEGVSELADDFGKRCFVVDPQRRASAADLQGHDYLDVDPSWTFSGFNSEHLSS